MLAATVQPVIWSALGYQFEAASMIAGLSACLIVRAWVSLNSKRTRLAWAIDLTVTGLAMLFTAAWIALQRPAPFYALLSGTGLGAMGAGIISIAIAWVKRIEPLARRADDDEASSIQPAMRDASKGRVERFGNVAPPMDAFNTDDDEGWP